MNSILYIDDDIDDQAIFSDVIEMIKPDLKCYLANDGYQAFDLLQNLQELPAYIFLDMNMPRMTGTEFLRTIKTIDGLVKLPVVIFSTSKTPRVEEEALALGAIDYVLKAVSIDELTATLSKFLNSH